MNKKELIKKYKELENGTFDIGALVVCQSILKDLEQLDEPQKVTIPQFVAEYIEWTKEEDFHLLGAMNRENFDKKLDDWFYTDDNIEVFARAWLDGYEVEKELKYTVKIKGINGYGQYLNKALLSKEYFFASNNEVSGYRTKHTKKQLEDDGFGEVFNSPLFEIEEVE